jgi:antitoxin component YwqK of YwqJK toxin-antitoxin module
VPSDKLLERNGIKYEINSQTPFAGVATEYWENGQLAYKDTYKGGRRNGPSERYYENGQLRWKLAYKDEKQHGPNERYYENGQLMATFTNKDGRLHGLWEGYYENGQEKDGSPVCYKTDEKVDISKCK